MASPWPRIRPPRTARAQTFAQRRRREGAATEPDSPPDPPEEPWVTGGDSSLGGDSSRDGESEGEATVLAVGRVSPTPSARLATFAPSAPPQPQQHAADASALPPPLLGRQTEQMAPSAWPSPPSFLPVSMPAQYPAGGDARMSHTQALFAHQQQQQQMLLLLQQQQWAAAALGAQQPFEPEGAWGAPLAP